MRLASKFPMACWSRTSLILAIAALLLVRPVSAQPDLTVIRPAVVEFQQICEEQGRLLWATSLCGPLLLVDPKTRLTVATAPDPDHHFAEKDGLFTGTLPLSMTLANTSVRWGASDWAMILLPLPLETFSRVRLLGHESFHRVQRSLSLDAPDAPNGHLDTETGRLWLRMELRALSQALRLDGPAAREAARDALLFRAARRQLNPGAETHESELEIQEGLAEYTGSVLALKASGESLARVARDVESFEDRIPTYSRSFAYATTPALGLLLDRYAGAWRKNLTRHSDLSELLAVALRFRLPPGVVDRARARADRYGFRAVSADEHSRQVRAQALLAGYRARFLQGPVLRFPKTEALQRTFNPNNLFTLGGDGTVYPAGIFTAGWGRLQIDDVGGLLSPDNQSLRVSAPADIAARPVLGPGWRLDLAPGWTIRPASQAGDFEVVREN